MLDVLFLIVAVLMGAGCVACGGLLAAIEWRTCLSTLAPQQTSAAIAIGPDVGAAGIGCPCTAVAAALARPAPALAIGVLLPSFSGSGGGTR